MTNAYSLKGLLQYFFLLGATGFGGFAAITHTLHTDLVLKRKWITNNQFMRGIALSQLAPGPLAAQLVIYIGFIKSGIVGATAGGLAFIAPSFFIVLLLSAVYRQVGSLPLVQAALTGMGASVIGIIAYSGLSLTKRFMAGKTLLWGLYAAIFAVVLWTKTINVSIFVAAGVIAMLAFNREKLKIPKAWSAVPATVPFFWPFLASDSHPLLRMFELFFAAGSIAFGGGLAIITFLQQGVVNEFHWLTAKQFVDGITISMATPGPVVIVSAFIGFLTHGVPGALVATLGILLPVYLIVIFLTPFFVRHAENPHMVAFVEGTTTAAMASITASIWLLGRETITDLYAFGLAVMSFVTVKFLRLPGIVAILISLAAGLIIHA